MTLLIPDHLQDLEKDIGLETASEVSGARYMMLTALLGIFILA